LKRFTATILATILLLSAWVALCGMGLLPEGEAKVPKTKENFAATVYDASGASTRLTHFSIDGDTFVPARLGEGTLSMPFGNIDEMSLSGAKATVRLKGGRVAEVTVDKGLDAAGLSDFGPYHIKLKDVRRVVIHGKP